VGQTKRQKKRGGGKGVFGQLSKEGSHHGKVNRRQVGRWRAGIKGKKRPDRRQNTGGVGRTKKVTEKTIREHAGGIKGENNSLRKMKREKFKVSTVARRKNMNGTSLVWGVVFVQNKGKENSGKMEGKWPTKAMKRLQKGVP